MKRKFLVGLTAAFTALCMMFGIAACGETEKSGNTGGSSQEQQQPGESQSGGTTKPDEGQGGTTKPDEGQGGTTKPDEGQGGSQEKPDEGQGGTTKPDEGQQPDDGEEGEQKPNEPSENQIAVELYIDGELSETLYTDSSEDYKITLPQPKDMTTDPELDYHFDGWYADELYLNALTGEEAYHSASAIYGRNITWKASDFKYTVEGGGSDDYLFCK